MSCKSDDDSADTPSGYKTCNNNVSAGKDCVYLMDCFCQDAAPPPPPSPPTGCHIDPYQGCSGMCAHGYCSASSSGGCDCWSSEEMPAPCAVSECAVMEPATFLLRQINMAYVGHKLQ